MKETASQEVLLEEMLDIVEEALNTSELKRPTDIVNEIVALVEKTYDI